MKTPALPAPWTRFAVRLYGTEVEVDVVLVDGVPTEQWSRRPRVTDRGPKRLTTPELAAVCWALLEELKGRVQALTEERGR